MIIDDINIFAERILNNKKTLKKESKRFPRYNFKRRKFNRVDLATSSEDIFIEDSKGKLINLTLKNKRREIYRITSRIRRYGISYIEYNNLLIKQDYKCAICKTKELNKNLSVDHNHNSGKIRGLLCNGCNTGIGLLKDNINNLESAINYLKENGSYAK